MNQSRASTVALLASLAATLAWAEDQPAGPPPADGAPPMGMKMPSADEMFQQLDTNHDGKISKEEFMSARMMMGRHGGGPGMNHHGDGPPSGAPPQGGPPPEGPPPGASPPPAGAQGAGPPADMRARMEERRAEHFKELDKNGDGVVSQDEFKAGMAAMRAKRDQERAHMHGEKPGDDSTATH